MDRRMKMIPVADLQIGDVHKHTPPGCCLGQIREDLRNLKDGTVAVLYRKIPRKED